MPETEVRNKKKVFSRKLLMKVEMQLFLASDNDGEKSMLYEIELSI